MPPGLIYRCLSPKGLEMDVGMRMIVGIGRIGDITSILFMTAISYKTIIRNNHVSTTARSLRCRDTRIDAKTVQTHPPPRCTRVKPVNSITFAATSESLCSPSAMNNATRKMRRTSAGEVFIYTCVFLLILLCWWFFCVCV